MAMRPVLASGEWQQSATPEGGLRAANPETGEWLAPEYPVSCWDELDAIVRAGACWRS